MLNVFCLMKRTKNFTTFDKETSFQAIWNSKCGYTNLRCTPGKIFNFVELVGKRTLVIGNLCWWVLILIGNVTVRLHDIGAFHSWSLRFWMYCIISVIRLQISGQHERAAAVALFNNKIREAIKILSSDRLRDNSMGGTGKKPAFKPFKPQYPHTNSPNWSPYISLTN